VSVIWYAKSSSKHGEEAIEAELTRAQVYLEKDCTYRVRAVIKEDPKSPPLMH